MKLPGFGTATLILMALTITTVIAMILTGCPNVITTVPDVSELPTIVKSEVKELLLDYGIWKSVVNSTVFSREIYSIPELETVREIQEAAWLAIGLSPYDERDRNCVDFARALDGIFAVSLPSAPIGVVLYLDFVCSVDRCDVKGHALLVFITQDHEVMFIESRIEGRIYPLDRDVIITEIRM